MTDYEAPALGGRRVIRITLRKKGIGMMVHWWRCALKGGTVIPTDAIPGRAPGKVSAALFRLPSAERATHSLNRLKPLARYRLETNSPCSA